MKKLSLPRIFGVDEAPPLPSSSALPLANDGVLVGHVLNPFTQAAAGEFRLPLDELNRGTAVVGAAGSGKTNTVLQLLHGLPDSVSGLVLDIKREYRALARTRGAEVFNFHNRLLTHNLLKPVGAPDQYAKQFADIFSEVISRNVPASGSKDVIVQELDKLYATRGVYEGSTDYPHIGDLATALAERSQATLSDRERNWLASALRVLGTLAVGKTQSAFCVRNGIALERLLTGLKVIELDAIGDRAGSALFVGVLLQKIRNHLMDREKNSALRHVFVIEEAQNVLARGNEAGSVLQSAARELRGFGVGLVYVSQMPSELSKDAMANVATVISHRLAHPEDLAFVASLLGTDRTLLSGLQPGVSVVKNGATAFMQVPAVERPHLRDDELPEVAIEREEVAASFAQRESVSNRLQDLTPRDWAVFLSVAEGTAVYAKAIGEALQYSVSEVSNILSRLVRKGLLYYLPVRPSRGGRSPSIYFLNTFGYESYRQKNGRYPDRRVGASPNHGELLHTVIEKLAIVRKPHARFDLLYDKGAVERAIEVETGANHDEQLNANVKKSVEFQGEARFVAADRRTYNRILQAAAKYAFTDRTALNLQVATVENLPNWDGYWIQAPDTRTKSTALSATGELSGWDGRRRTARSRPGGAI